MLQSHAPPTALRHRIDGTRRWQYKTRRCDWLPCNTAGIEEHWMVLKRPKTSPAPWMRGPVCFLSLVYMAVNMLHTTVDCTTQDSGLIQKTPWLRADLVPFQDSFERAMFRGLVLLFSHVFRQGMMGIQYAVLENPCHCSLWPWTPVTI